MKSVLTITPTTKPYFRLLHITDTHLFASTEEQLLGVKTQQSYHAVLERIAQEGRHYDAVLATGDLVQDHAEQGYHAFCQGMSTLAVPCVWLQGNHDETAYMDALLNQGNVLPYKHVTLGKEWVVILLNSHLSGAAAGLLTQDVLHDLDATLAANSEKQIVIALHHHPAPVGCKWLDAHQLKNADEFYAIVSRYDNIRLVICGHIHQEVDVAWAGTRLLSTPSTCVQFKPQSAGFALDNKQPGWREIILHPNGDIETTVYYLPGNAFLPDESSEGY